MSKRLTVSLFDDKRSREQITDQVFSKIPTITVDLSHSEVVYVTVGDEAFEFADRFDRRSLSVTIH